MTKELRSKKVEGNKLDKRSQPFIVFKRGSERGGLQFQPCKGEIKTRHTIELHDEFGDVGVVQMLHHCAGVVLHSQHGRHHMRLVTRPGEGRSGRVSVYSFVYSMIWEKSACSGVKWWASVHSFVYSIL